METENKDIQEEIDWKTKYLYLAAEYDNYKKNVLKDRENTLKYPDLNISYPLIGIADDIMRACSFIGTENIPEGIRLIFDKYFKILNERGIKIIETNIEDEFNLNTMNAISTIPTDNEELNNKVQSIISSGYMYKDKVIKYTDVIVYSFINNTEDNL